MSQPPFVARPRFLLGASALGAGALVVGCTSNEPANANSNQAAAGGGDNDQAGKDATIGFPARARALPATGQEVMDKDLPVINLDRVFDPPLAYRTWIGGDNYRMGVNAGGYIAEQMKAKGVSNPVIGEVAGIDSLPLTQERSKGFKDALAKAGFKVGPRVAAEFTAESGEKQTGNLLRGGCHLDALWNHDDDQGI